jgi:hypothetical protein
VAPLCITACSHGGVVEEDAWRFEISGPGFHAELEEPGASLREVFSGDGCARTQRLNGYAFDASGNEYAANIPVGPTGTHEGPAGDAPRFMTLFDGTEDTYAKATVTVTHDEPELLEVSLHDLQICSDFLATTCTPSPDVFDIRLHAPITAEWSVGPSASWVDLETGAPLCF